MGMNVKDGAGDIVVSLMEPSAGSMFLGRCAGRRACAQHGGDNPAAHDQCHAHPAQRVMASSNSSTPKMDAKTIPEYCRLATTSVARWVCALA